MIFGCLRSGILDFCKTANVLMKRGQQTKKKPASPGTTPEGLGLTPQQSAEEISRRDASLTCVVSITSLKAERPEPSEIDHRTISQQQQQRGLGQRTEKEQLCFPKKEYITENLGNGCRGRIILFQTDAIVGFSFHAER